MGTEDKELKAPDKESKVLDKELKQLGLTEEQIKALREKKLLIDVQGSLDDKDVPDFLKKLIDESAKKRSDIIKSQLYDTIETLKERNKALSNELASLSEYVNLKKKEEEELKKKQEEEMKKQKEEELKRAPVEEKLSHLGKELEEKTRSIKSEAEKRIQELEQKLHLETMKNYKLQLLSSNSDPKVAELLPDDEALLTYTKEDLKKHFDKASELVKSIREETEKKLREELDKQKDTQKPAEEKTGNITREAQANLANIFLGRGSIYRDVEKYKDMTIEQLKEKARELASKLPG